MTMTTDHFVFFGDLEAAEIIESKEYIRKDGVEMVSFILIPSGRIEGRFKTQTEQDPEGRMLRDYPKTDVMWIERGIHRTRCLITTDFNGGATRLSRQHYELSEALKDLMKLIRSAESGKNKAYEELRIEREFQRMALKQKADQLREVSKARGRSSMEEQMEGAEMVE